MSDRRTTTQNFTVPILKDLFDSIIHTSYSRLSYINRLSDAPNGHGRRLVVRIIEAFTGLDKIGETGGVNVAVGVG
jgi:hypothetical protein